MKRFVSIQKQEALRQQRRHERATHVGSDVTARHGNHQQRDAVTVNSRARRFNEPAGSTECKNRVMRALGDSMMQHPHQAAASSSPVQYTARELEKATYKSCGGSAHGMPCRMIDQAHSAASARQHFGCVVLLLKKGPQATKQGRTCCTTHSRSILSGSSKIGCSCHHAHTIVLPVRSRNAARAPHPAADVSRGRSLTPA